VAGMLFVAPDFWSPLPFVTLLDVAPGLSTEEAGETGDASGEKTDILDSLSMDGAIELSRVTELSVSLEDFFDAGGGMSVIFFSGEPERGIIRETIVRIVAVVIYQ
jgi:hypothetical protein